MGGVVGGLKDLSARSCVGEDPGRATRMGGGREGKGRRVRARMTAREKREEEVKGKADHY